MGVSRSSEPERSECASNTPSPENAGLSFSFRRGKWRSTGPFTKGLVISLYFGGSPRMIKPSVDGKSSSSEVDNKPDGCSTRWCSWVSPGISVRCVANSSSGRLLLCKNKEISSKQDVSYQRTNSSMKGPILARNQTTGCHVVRSSPGSSSN